MIKLKPKITQAAIWVGDFRGFNFCGTDYVLTLVNCMNICSIKFFQIAFTMVNIP